MNLVKGLLDIIAYGIPRVSGGEPRADITHCVDDPYSPRERG